MSDVPVLIALSGLPGVGKSTVAAALVRRTGAVHLRVDSVEAALKRSALAIDPAEDAGYLALAAVARDNLALGHTVIADTVNPVAASRMLWADTARAAGAICLDVELVCSDRAEHRRRVEGRTSDIPGLALPDWARVTGRDYEPRTDDRLMLDTAILSPADAVARIVAALAA
ncbi:AAA family ATPase [Amorphus orientalis]|uniref:Kinase n=1 Tax=Amorphus orientalis TaxID=649198 RepID=A0AAE3VN10_9HYPH|nr:ATP-binding protein [Amorphus orientalis]MDQ0315068.1 putative kinase [Amorphus orientalis]